MLWRLDASSWRAKASGVCGWGFWSIIPRSHATPSAFSKKPSEKFNSISSSTCCSREISRTRAPQTVDS